MQNHFVKILINVDGILLIKSNRKELLTILGLVRVQTMPFPIGIWRGVENRHHPTLSHAQRSQGFRTDQEFF